MSLVSLFKRAVDELNACNCEYAVGGGFAADLYRMQVRGTGDIDFLFYTNGREVEKGKKLLANLNLSGNVITSFDLKRMPGMSKKSADAYVIVGREGKQKEGVDLLLPRFSWFSSAIKRAQFNRFDFGHGIGFVPTLTVEDVILAKIDAGRLKDKDDINSIFESHADEDSEVRLDLNYLISQMEILGLNLPDECVRGAPTALRVLKRRGTRSKKAFP